MRPIRLRVSAFGPFAETEVVDFEALGGDPLFLITGATGSGKSTLLDAMCFGLYGKSLGGSRSGEQLRSDYAGPERPTEVVFEFALGAERYRVERTPKQERASQRKKGAVTTALPTAELWRIEEPEELLASGVKNVDAAILRILGFAVEDFRQVVMLPQGRFRELLSASSQDRQKVLARIFDTARFRDLVDRLKKAHSALKIEAEKGRLRVSNLLESAGAESVEHLDERIVNGVSTCHGVEEEVERASLTVQQAEQALQADQQTQGHFDALRVAEQRLVELRDNEPRVAALRKQLERAKAAEKLVPLAEQLTAARVLAEQAERDRLVALQTKNAAELDFAGAEKQQKAAEDNASRVPDRIAEAQKLQAMGERIGALRGLEAEVQDKREAADRHEAQHRVKEAEAERLKTEIAALEERLKTVRSQESKKRLLDHQRDQVNRARDRVTLDLQLDNGRRVLEEQEALAAKTKQSLHDLEKREREANAAYVQDLSGGLAAELSEGSPCPVCGSTSHPDPATPRSTTPSMAGIEALREDIRACKRALESAREAVNQKAQELEGVRGKRSALPEFEGSLEALEAELSRLEAGIGTLGEDDSVEGLEAALEEARKHHAKAEAESTEAFGEARAAQQAHTGAQKSLAEAESALPDGYTSAAHVEARQAQIREFLERTEAEMEAAKRLYSSKLVARSEAVTAAELAQESAEKARGALRLLQDRLEESRRELGFADEAEWGAARRSGAEIDGLEGRIQEAAAEKQAAAMALSDAKAKVEGLEPVLDLPQKVAALGGLREARDRAIHRQGEFTKVLEQLRRFREQITECEESNREVEERYAVAAQLAETAKGKNELKLDFERYVLGVMLDDVLQTAGQRLQLMSRGRYTLHRAMGLVDGRKASGLDLEVMDHWTGVARPVSTLSGGEGFLAALALALGLADVIQAYSGGIRLDAVFVDEGFGSLDPEALEQAMRALEELRSAGRMVGIISHVSELKVRIDTRLELVQTRRGSRIRTVVS